MTRSTPTVGWHPLHLLAVAGSVGVFVVVAAQPIRDEDVWWHSLIGDEILASRRVSGLGNEWAPFGDPSWTTTQWFSEVLYSLTVEWGGWESLTLLRLATAAATIMGLALVVLRQGPPMATVPVFTIAILGTALWLSRDRPQSLVLPLTVVVGWWIQGSRAGRYPPVWQVALLTALWSNLHGSWVVVPAAWGLVMIAALLDHERGSIRPPLIRAVVGAAAGMLNPAAFASLTAVVRFRESTGHILEWEATAVFSNFGLLLALLLALAFWGWARSAPVPRGELAIAIAIGFFGFVAVRNVPTAIILLAPLVAHRLALLVPEQRKVTRREAIILKTLAGLLVVAGVGAAAAFHQRTDPLEEVTAMAAVRAIPSHDDGVRVMNDYALGGLIARFGPTGVEVSVDGRADRYSPDYVERHLAAQYSLLGWESLVAEIQPDYVLFPESSALPTHLAAVGWPTIYSESGLVVLENPESGPSPTAD